MVKRGAPTVPHAYCRQHKRSQPAAPSSPAAAVRPPAPLLPEEVWYFAYGSNMALEVLTGRRLVKPKESIPCFIPDHVLSFRVLGFPYAEPGFATIEPSSNRSPAFRAAQPSRTAQPRSSSYRQGTHAVTYQQQQQQQQELHSGSTFEEKTQQAQEKQELQQKQHHHHHQHLQQQGSTVITLPLSAAPEGCVHGVLHRISNVDWLKVQRSEGVGSQTAGYQVSMGHYSCFPGLLSLLVQPQFGDCAMELPKSPVKLCHVPLACFGSHCSW